MPSAIQPPRTLYDKVFEDHIVDEKPDGTILLYIGNFNFFRTSVLGFNKLTILFCRSSLGTRSDFTSELSRAMRCLNLCKNRK